MRVKINAIKVLLAFLLIAQMVGMNALDICAYSDVVWEGPVEDSFFSSHQDECVEEGRYYITNGPDDMIVVYIKPNSKKEAFRLENGIKIYISFTYEDKDGRLWGIYEKYEDGKTLTGWILMDQLLNVYDAAEFRKEFEDEIVNESGTLSDEYEGKTIYFFDFPGQNADGTQITIDDAPGYSQTFVDELGYKWGYCSYYYSMRGWFCIDNPTATYDELYIAEAPVREIDHSDDNKPEKDITERKKDKSDKKDNGSLTDKGTMVAVVGTIILIELIASIILIVVLAKNGKNKRD